MTRRIRFSPFARAGVFAAGLVLAASGAGAGDVPFTTQPPISTSADGAFFVTSADVDGDGDLDVLSTSYYGDTVAWHENTAGDGTAWTLRTISTLANGAHSVFAADVDGDGDMDALSASPFDDKVAWYENTAGNGTAWTLRTISTLADGARSVFAADVDGDGDVDALSASAFDDKVAWYENTAGDGTAWLLRTISTAADAAFFVVAADVDGDGDLDALSGSVTDDKVAWYENTAGNGTAWTPRTISTAGDGVRSVFAADVDGDGDVDALSASREDDTVAWYENSVGDGTAWVLRTVSTAGNGARSVLAADVDGDGDLDVLSASSYDNTVAWHENTVGDGTLWTVRTISTAAVIAITVSAADLDGDGDLDVVSASAIDDKVAWYRNETLHESACFAAPFAITTIANNVSSVAAGDLDGDGDVDALAALTGGDRVEWYENANGDGSTWALGVVATGILQAEAAIPVDMDGDKDLDVLSIGYYSGLRWHRNEDGSGTIWTGIGIGATGFTAAAADVDGDGDTDAVSTMNFFDPLVKWYDNTAGDGTAWSFRTIALITLGGPSYGLAVADVDGDGDQDVISSTASGSPTPALLWFENTAGNGSAWTTRTVSPTEARDVAVADVDRDGDLDLVAGGLGGVFWHENTNGAGTAWTAHTVAPGSWFSLSTADLDFDGDVDVVAGGVSPASLAWAENTAGNGGAWSLHPLPPGSITGVDIADVDGDGELDVLTASGPADRVEWLEHRGGQFSLLASDTAPAGAVNGELVPMLSVVATHLGRAGDGDMELVGFGLRFEEAVGDPLTSAEANAVIESLRIYRDANGNGVFDPASDVLVATVTDLALTNGIQAVSFADGDPNLQVGFGTPRTYFVVTELTGNASSQNPNQFRVTHLGLGLSASTAEDRTYDIALRPACPADASSSVIGPITPVELLGFTVE